MPVEERRAFDAKHIAKINAIMKKAVRACVRVMSPAKQKARRIRRTR